MCLVEKPIGRTEYHRPGNPYCNTWPPGCTGCRCECFLRIPASVHGVLQHCANTCKRLKMISCFKSHKYSPCTWACCSKLPLRLQMIKSVNFGRELSHARAVRDIAAINIYLVRQSIQHCAVAVTSLYWIARCFNHSPFPRTKVILLHSIKISKLWGVSKDDDHPVLDNCGGVPSAMDLSTETAMAPPSLDQLPLPLEAGQVEAPQLLAHVATAHDTAVDVQFVLVYNHTVAIPEFDKKIRFPENPI